MGLSAICAVAVMFTHSQLGAMVLLSLMYAGVTFQQPVMFAVCLDIGGDYAGAIVGAMNTAAQAGSFLSSLAFGYLVAQFGSYNVPFIPMAVFLALGVWLWIRIDPATPLIAGEHTVALALSS
jgi:predicted MFS family arabinose efflux permease